MAIQIKETKRKIGNTKIDSNLVYAALCPLRRMVTLGSSCIAELDETPVGGVEA